MIGRCMGFAALAWLGLGIAAASAQEANKSPTMDTIRERGELTCGVDTGIPGFAFQDNTGKWQGFDITYCRAIAAAVLGDADKVGTSPTTAKVRFTVLQSGEIDVLIRDSTLTFTRNTQLGLAEIAVDFLAGQAFMVSKTLGVGSTQGLNGATICMITGATLELNIADCEHAATASRSTRCCSTSPRRRSPPPRPGAATATPMTAAASRPPARR